MDAADLAICPEPAQDTGLPAGPPLRVLEEIQRRVLWLATRMVDVANRERETGDGVKVGGHQASSASLVTAMTALWFWHLEPQDRVSVKPHASPVLHAIWYLLGELDASYLTSLRARGGLQSYPSRTKDPDRVDFSTGSVGLGAAAPLFAAVVRRYVDAHFGPRPASRFVVLLGDAELDEGNIWEAIAEPATQGLGNVLWVVDFNRQSLDRVVPGVRIQQWAGAFTAAGWNVIEVKYGRRLQAAFTQAGGDALRDWLDDMPNERYQSLFGLQDEQLREAFLAGAPDAVTALAGRMAHGNLAALITDLGGHDLECLVRAYEQADRVADRPSVIFAYTVKGWGLPIAGNPRNHSALLTAEQIAQLREAVGLTPEVEWDRFDPASEAGRWAQARSAHLRLPPRQTELRARAPAEVGLPPSKMVSTQDAFGRLLVGLSRDPQLSRYLVTAAPDVATSTNLAGFINRTGVFAPVQRRTWGRDQMLRWDEGPVGQHIELGISEMNLFLLLGQLGLAWDLSDQPLLAVGTVYDPFVLRGLDALIYSVYSGSRFIFAGTPSGISLAPEGGAHQSTITASVGLELPNVTFIEPAYAGALDWLLCGALQRIADQPGEPCHNGADAQASIEAGAYYFRLSTRPLEQAPFLAARQRLGQQELRRQVLAGAYRLIDAGEIAAAGGPVVHLAASGAVLPEVLEAARLLHEEGVAAHVVDVTSADRLYRGWQRGVHQEMIHRARVPTLPRPIAEAFPERAPVVTVHDAASHAMAWLGSALGVPTVSLGVDTFGQSGAVSELYEIFDLRADRIVNAALGALAADGLL